MSNGGTQDRERVPTHEEIAVLAYSYWEARGRPDGSPWEDWFRAERELAWRQWKEWART